ncbi:ABC transporter permease subunit, partial [Rhizobiaceae sp. 2RAB30]
MPTPEHPLGLDGYGRDVLTRLMNGGLTILLLVTATTTLVYAVGVPVGLFTALHGRALSTSVLWLFDCLLAFPPLLLVLLLAASTGGGVTTAVVAVAASQVPWVTRLVRAAASEVAANGYVDTAR